MRATFPKTSHRPNKEPTPVVINVVVARLIMNTAPDVLPVLDTTQRVRLFFILPAGLLLVITFFLVGSIWGARAAWHGLGVGTLAFLGVFSIGAGWRAAGGLGIYAGHAGREPRGQGGNDDELFHDLRSIGMRDELPSLAVAPRGGKGTVQDTKWRLLIPD